MQIEVKDIWGGVQDPEMRPMLLGLGLAPFRPHVISYGTLTTCAPTTSGGGP